MGKVLHFTISIPAALVAAVVALSALTLRLPSRLVALYYQEQGARALARALLAEGRAGEGGLWLEPEPLTRPDAQALAAQALERFQAAIAADPANFQAHRWLGRAALLLDRPGDAVAAFSAAVRLRPDNPLGWWELGLAYDHLAPPMPFSWGDRPEEEGPASAGELSQPALIDRTSSPPRRIPAVGVEAPAVESSAGAPLPVWGYARWPLPDAPGGWPGWWVPDEPVPRTVLFAAVPATVTFRVSLPVTPAALVFWMGMDPALQAPQGDGVVYRVWVEDREIFSHTLRPQEVRAGWWPARADLTPWAGRTVRLTLTLDPGPAGDPNGDWAGWGDAQLVEAARAGGVLAGAERRAVAAWRAGGISAQQLIEAGEEARNAKRYEEALRWYRKASGLNPADGENLLRAGLVYEEIGKLEEAEQMYRIAWSIAPAKATKYLSLLLEKRGEYGAAEQILREALFNYPDASDRLEWWRALGNNLQLQGRWDEAFSIYVKAIEEFPNDPALYVGLGWTRYKRGDGLEAALGEMHRALALDSESGDVHIIIGMLMGEARHCDEADTWFRLGLERNPYSAWGHLMRANYARACGNLDFALSLYQETLALFPNFAAAYHEIALVYKLNNQPQEAVDAVEKSLKLMDPPDPWFYVRAGEIYEWAGMLDDAVAAYQHALALDPNNSVALQALQRVGK